MTCKALDIVLPKYVNLSINLQFFFYLLVSVMTGSCGFSRCMLVQSVALVSADYEVSCHKTYETRSIPSYVFLSVEAFLYPATQ